MGVFVKRDPAVEAGIEKRFDYLEKRFIDQFFGLDGYVDLKREAKGAEPKREAARFREEVRPPTFDFGLPVLPEPTKEVNLNDFVSGKIGYDEREELKAEQERKHQEEKEEIEEVNEGEKIAKAETEEEEKKEVQAEEGEEESMKAGMNEEKKVQDDKVEESSKEEHEENS